MKRPQRWLKLFLVLGGLSMCLAVFAVVMPTSWMVWVHDKYLGMGEFPDRPVVEYLVRSVSMLYAGIGGLLLLAATDLVRYSRMIQYLAVFNIVLGGAVLGISIEARMPVMWIVGEGPLGVVYGMALLILQAKGGKS